MTMSQNSLSYLDNDSAELQLGSDIQNYIAPNVKGSVEVDFDGYGTLHVLERADDGKLLSDSYLARQEDENVFSTNNEYTNTDRLSRLMRSNMHLGRALKIQKVLITVFAILFVLFCILLRMTLQRYM